jgi:uncharacterized protein (TIGR02246 family)
VSLRTFDQRRSLCPRRYGCYRRLREIPQQVVRRQIVLNPREKTIKIRLVVALAGLAISFALPTFAQQKETVDPQLIQNLHDTIISKKYNDAINNHDAAAIAALFTDDVIFVTDTVGPLYGRQAIEKFYADDFKGWQPKNHTSTTDPHSARMLGPDNLTRAGVWSETGKGKNGEDVPIKGYWSEIDTRQGDGWKVCVLTGNLTADSWALIYKSFGLPPAATSSPTASPSGQ